MKKLASLIMAILMDVGSGQILYEKNAHDKLPPASVTKVMTMLLICEALDSGKITLDDSVKLYDEAGKLIKELREELSNAEKKVKIFVEEKDNEAVVKDFEEA